jgi:hypothetical protein
MKQLSPQVLGFHQVEDLDFPSSLPEFQRLFPDDAACAAYLERIRWEHSFECPHCGEAGEPYRFAARPGVLRCKSCRRDVALTAGTVMQRTHTPLLTWFWGAYLVSSITPGISAIQFQRQLGLGRYETAFQILHKLRASMVCANLPRIGGARPNNHVEVDETWIGGVGEGRRTEDQMLVVAAVEVCQQTPTPKGKGAGRARVGRLAERLRLEVVPDRSTTALCGFVEATVESGTTVVTDADPGYVMLAERGYQHTPVIKGGKQETAEDYLSMVRLVFLNLKSWLRGTHHGVSPQHLQAYLNEFAFRFNHRSHPFSAFRSLLGLASESEAPTYAELYSGHWKHMIPH